MTDKVLLVVAGYMVFAFALGVLIGKTIKWGPVQGVHPRLGVSWVRCRVDQQPAPQVRRDEDRPLMREATAFMLAVVIVVVAYVVTVWVIS